MRDDLRLDPNSELFTWGPVPVHMFYGDGPLSGCATDFRSFGINYEWPKGLILFKEGRMIWIHEQRDIDNYGAQLFRELFANSETRQRARKGFDEAVDELTSLELEMQKTNLSTLSNPDFISIWKRLLHKIAAFWAHGFPPEMAAYGGLVVLEDQLDNVSSASRNEVLQVLTAPEHISFYQKEEVDLYTTTDLTNHAHQYAWLTNSYAHVTELSDAYFSERKQALPANLLQESQRRLMDVRNAKEAMVRKYSLSADTITIATALCDCITWQDDRKKHIWVYLQYIERILLELTRRFGLEREHCLQLRHDEILNHIEKGRDIPSLGTRWSGAGFQIGHGLVLELTHNEAQELWAVHVPSHSQSATHIKGVVASKGNGLTKGTVRIVTDPLNTPHFSNGDILVTSMTTPDCVFLMKRAGAIITDTGGLTSHAAVVSRELHVACIVGTKIATQALKDGDLVEVDTRQGIVKKL